MARELFRTYVTQNFPILDIQVQEAQSPKQDQFKEDHTRYTVIKKGKIKDKENIKSSKGKNNTYHTNRPIKLSTNFSRDFSGEKEVAQYILKK